MTRRQFFLVAVGLAAVWRRGAVDEGDVFVLDCSPIVLVPLLETLEAGPPQGGARD